jgi:hypothetical protein
VYDAAGSSAAALLRAVDFSPAGSLVGVSGNLDPADSDMDVVLEFPAANPVPAHLWHLALGNPGPPFVHELPFESGDRFTPRLYRESVDLGLEPFAGESLLFDDVPTLYRSRRALENGTYDITASGTVLGGNSAGDSVGVSVDQSSAAQGFRAFADPALGLTILYPEGWNEPLSVADAARTSSAEGDTTLQIRVLDSWTGDAPMLLAEALSTLGGVTTLFEDTVAIGGEATAVSGARLAYGYPGADGQVRTGILTAFVRDGMGYIIDLDGLQSDEKTLLELANTVAANLKFLPSTVAPMAGWGDAVLGGYEISYPLGMAFEDVNGWYRFVEGDRFIAVRVQPATRTSTEALAALLAAAGEGVEGFEVVSFGAYQLAGDTWQQGDFAYTNADGTAIAGTVLTRPDGDNEIAVWSEWPLTDDAERSAAVALAVAATMQLYITPSPGN